MYLSSTFNAVLGVKSAVKDVFYWLIDIALTNQHSCILRDVS